MAYYHRLVEEDNCDQVLRAREMPGDQKMIEGFRLFETECELMRIVLRRWNPTADNAQIEEKLRDNLRRQKEKEYAGIYVDIEPGTSEEEVVETWRNSRRKPHS